MAYVITQPCVGRKEASCVGVCPVDCIHPTPDEPGYAEAVQLYIDPDECIECDACAPLCPVDAIHPQDMLPADLAHFAIANAEFYRTHP
jgi:NAD-dependent dihydropyrimidine dehydrogenase PreA subunit